MMDAYKAARNLLERDCTVNLNGDIVDAKRGYWVGGRLTLQFSVDQPRERIEPILAAWIEALPKNARYVGAWRHGEKLFIDVSDLISNRDNALTVGKRRGELAVWDIRNAREIAL